MEVHTQQWYSDMVMDDIFLDDWELTNLNEFTTQNTNMGLGQEVKQFHIPEKPSKSSASSRSIISFGRVDSQKGLLNLYDDYVEDVKPTILVNDYDSHIGSKRKYEEIYVQGAKYEEIKASKALHNKEHVLAERRRREKLSEKFVALSAIVPGLKKLDKASVLGDAIKYLKQLEEKVKQLQEQSSKRTFETSFTLKKSQHSPDDTGFSSDVEFDDKVPEIEARMSEETILIKIHCETRKGLLVKLLSEIEKCKLCIVNTNVIQFDASSIDITVMTQIEQEFDMSVKDIVKRLNSLLRQ